jgi:hypothetical protein
MAKELNKRHLQGRKPQRPMIVWQDAQFHQELRYCKLKPHQTMVPLPPNLGQLEEECADMEWWWKAHSPAPTLHGLHEHSTQSGDTDTAMASTSSSILSSIPIHTSLSTCPQTAQESPMREPDARQQVAGFTYQKTVAYWIQSLFKS